LQGAKTPIFGLGSTAELFGVSPLKGPDLLWPQPMTP
jgi:hypothetical protein